LGNEGKLSRQEKAPASAKSKCFIRKLLFWLRGMITHTGGGPREMQSALGRRKSFSCDLQAKGRQPPSEGKKKQGESAEKSPTKNKCEALENDRRWGIGAGDKEWWGLEGLETKSPRWGERDPMDCHGGGGRCRDEFGLGENQ